MNPASGAYTSEFRYEFERDTVALLRRRFIWFTGVVGGLGVLVLALVVIIFVASRGESSAPPDVEQLRIIAVGVVSTLVYLGSMIAVLLRRVEGRSVLHLSMGIVIFDGVLNLVLRHLGGEMWGLPGFMISYTVAAAFLPWTVRQALVPAGVVLGLNAVLRLGMQPGFGVPGAIMATLGIIAVGPGLLICWWRQSARLRDSQFNFIQRRYGEVRRELTDARRIHEAMFPAPVTQGPVRFTYRYQPMRQIGGDYLHVAVSPTDCGSADRLCVVVLDVTGHGIPAALNVNRLYGELARIFGEDPCIEPGAVLRLLNRYVRLTMSHHSVYVTGLAVRVDPVHGVLEYANAGHPPAFQIGADGTIDRLDSTTFLLGAVEDAAFEPATRTRPFVPGDRLIAYTDGATEAQNHRGRMLGIDGMLGLLASQKLQAEGGWPMTILTAVDAHRDGPPADDTLVIEVFRPVGEAGLRFEERVERAPRRADANDDSRMPV
ncbi:MAG: PP2C family protein-serine/threonine phosphatase [Phycisphaerales bacterium]